MQIFKKKKKVNSQKNADIQENCKGVRTREKRQDSDQAGLEAECVANVLLMCC